VTDGLPPLPTLGKPVASPPDLSPLPTLGPTGDLPPIPTIGPVSRRVPAGGARREWQLGEVVAVRHETARAKTLRLWLPKGHPHVPGQHYVVRVADDEGLQMQRSYSVASAPEPGASGSSSPGTHIELTVDRLDDGFVSPILHDDVDVGDSVEVRGPFGGWFIWRGDTPALLVGGGSGVVPLMSMVRHWRREGSDLPLALVVSVRSAADLFYSGEYGPETTIVYTRTAPAGWPRPPARLDAATLAPLVERLAPVGAVAYVCGSAGFAEAASQLLVDVGMKAASVRVERFGPSG
jgi:ferredoxin-NADP reductase